LTAWTSSVRSAARLHHGGEHNMTIRIRVVRIALTVAFTFVGVAGSTQRSATAQNVPGTIASSKRMVDGKEWTTANLNVNASGGQRLIGRRSSRTTTPTRTGVTQGASSPPLRRQRGRDCRRWAIRQQYAWNAPTGYVPRRHSLLCRDRRLRGSGSVCRSVPPHGTFPYRTGMMQW
jgi:hypothetical protein